MTVTVEWMRENYEKFNDMFFEGQLPQISFSINNRLTTAWGRAMATLMWSKGKVIPKGIQMTDKRDLPENVQWNILVHEMIHVLDYSTHPEHYMRMDWDGKYRPVKGYDAHGKWFQGECDRINGMNMGITVSVRIQEWEKETMQWSEKEQQKIDKKKREGAFIGYIREINENAAKPWFKIKTNKTGMNKYIQEITTHKWYKGYIAYVDWYKSFDERDLSLKNRTSRGWWTDTKVKDKEIKEHQMDFLERIVVNPDFEDTEELQKMTSDDYISWFEKALHGMFERIWSTSQYNGYNKCELTEPNSDLNIVMTIDWENDNMNLRFNNTKSLNIKRSAFVLNGAAKYAKIVYKYLIDNGLLTENKMNKKDKIIREIIEQFANNVQNNDVEVSGEPGQRMFVKNISDDASIIAVE